MMAQQQYNQDRQPQPTSQTGVSMMGPPPMPPPVPSGNQIMSNPFQSMGYPAGGQNMGGMGGKGGGAAGGWLNTAGQIAANYWLQKQQQNPYGPGSAYYTSPGAYSQYGGMTMPSSWQGSAGAMY
jgi:hypothetical protein